MKIVTKLVVEGKVSYYFTLLAIDTALFRLQDNLLICPNNKSASYGPLSIVIDKADKLLQPSPGIPPVYV